MGTNDTHRQFEKIVAHLNADYPSLAGRRRPSRRVLITTAAVGGVLWGLLSVTMVAWGVVGIVLTCSTVAVTGIGSALVAHRRRRR